MLKAVGDKGSWRRRRTAYKSGRLELIGKLDNPLKRPIRKIGDSARRQLARSPISHTDFKSTHRWRRY